MDEDQAFDCVNSEVLEERVAAASTRATLALRALGLSLNGIPIPTYYDVWTYLAGLVSQAILGHHEAMERQGANQEDVEGFSSDDKYFEVTVQGKPDGSLNLTVLLILV